jgi:hypothetical protein
VNDRVNSISASQKSQQLVRRNDISNAPFGNISPFCVVVAQRVDDDDIFAAVIELCSDVRSDKSGSTGDDMYSSTFFSGGPLHLFYVTGVPSEREMMLVVLCPFSSGIRNTLPPHCPMISLPITS